MRRLVRVAKPGRGIDRDGVNPTPLAPGVQARPRPPAPARAATPRLPTKISSQEKILGENALIPLPPTGFACVFCAIGAGTQSRRPPSAAGGPRARTGISHCERNCDAVKFPLHGSAPAKAWPPPRKAPCHAEKSPPRHFFPTRCCGLAQRIRPTPTLSSTRRAPRGMPEAGA